MAANAGDIYGVRVFYSGPGGVYENGLSFLARQAVAGDAQLDLANAFTTAMIKNTNGGLLYAMANSVSTNHLQVEDIKPGTVATYEHTYSTVSGRLAAEALPAQCAVVMTLATLVKGRSYRGRIYLPGLPETYDTAGALTATAIADITTIETNLLAVFGPAGSNANWQLCVVSRYLNKIKRATPVGTAVASLSFDTIVRTQRRRVLGVGN